MPVIPKALIGLVGLVAAAGVAALVWIGPLHSGNQPAPASTPTSAPSATPSRHRLLRRVRRQRHRRLRHRRTRRRRARPIPAVAASTRSSRCRPSTSDALHVDSGLRERFSDLRRASVAACHARADCSRGRDTETRRRGVSPRASATRRRVGIACGRRRQRGPAHRASAVPRDPGRRDDGGLDRARLRRRLSVLDRWSVLPDFASVNLGEEGALEVIDLLNERGVGVEAGVWTTGDAHTLLDNGLDDACRACWSRWKPYPSPEAQCVSRRRSTSFSTTGSPRRRDCTTVAAWQPGACWQPRSTRVTMCASGWKTRSCLATALGDGQRRTGVGCGRDGGCVRTRDRDDQLVLQRLIGRRRCGRPGGDPQTCRGRTRPPAAVPRCAECRLRQPDEIRGVDA